MKAGTTLAPDKLFRPEAYTLYAETRQEPFTMLTGILKWGFPAAVAALVGLAGPGLAQTDQPKASNRPTGPESRNLPTRSAQATKRSWSWARVRLSSEPYVASRMRPWRNR